MLILLVWKQNNAKLAKGNGFRKVKIKGGNLEKKKTVLSLIELPQSRSQQKENKVPAVLLNSPLF